MRETEFGSDDNLAHLELIDKTILRDRRKLSERRGGNDFGGGVRIGANDRSKSARVAWKVASCYS